MSDGVECLICGVEENDHHDFTPPPKGCVCEPAGWRGSDHVPGMCKNFSASAYDETRCEHCEHDEGCHKPQHTQEGP